VPPNLLAIALLLQAHDKVSDAEATKQAAYDMRWKVALSVEMDERPFAKSTLQLFRAQLVIHDQAQAVFVRNLEYARQVGYLKGRKARVAVDSTHIFGRGAVEDTYNLIAHGIAKLYRVLAQTPYFDQQYCDRVVIEHRIGRLVGLGIRQSRYCGRMKTQFQALMAATVANLTLMASWMGTEGVLGDFLRRCFVRSWARAASVAFIAVFRERKPDNNRRNLRSAHPIITRTQISPFAARKSAPFQPGF